MGADEMTSTMQPPRTSQAPAAATGSPAGATPPAGEVGWRASDVLGRIVAMLLLPLSIAPVLLLGPSVLRAPVALSREAWGEVQRLERSLQPAHSSHPHAPAPAPGPSVWRPSVSLGAVYGRWSVSPQAGRTGITWTGAR
jgi:hypothetical protein